MAEKDQGAKAIIQLRPADSIPFMHGANVMHGANEQLAEQAMRRVKEQAPEEETETLAFVLAVFIAQAYKSEDLARTIVKRVFMSTDLFWESPLIQSLLKEAADEAGVQKSRELCQFALEGRFQTPGADILQAIGTADEATLKAIIAHVSSDTLEQVCARLGLEPQG